jgi:hypothetical protein
MNVTCGQRTPSVPPEKTVTADEGIFDSHTSALSVREKSFTQPLPERGQDAAVFCQGMDAHTFGFSHYA